MQSPPRGHKWSTRPYQVGDEPALTQLFASVYGRALSESHWRWKLKERPSPVENVWLAVDGYDRPIFHYAGIPVNYQLMGRPATAIVSVDAMTAPEFQRQGILTAVVPYIFERWREAGIPFTIGLPNEKWAHTPALGWRPLFSLQWLVRPLRPEALMARRLRLPLLSKLVPAATLWNGLWNARLRPDPTVQVHAVSQAGAEFDTLWQACAADTPLSMVRDSAWVNWRYLAPIWLGYRVLLAERQGRPAGYLAYRRQQNDGRTTGLIAEIQTQKSDDLTRRALIHHAVAELQEKGADTVAALAVPKTAAHNVLRRGGFRFSWAAFKLHIVPLALELPMDFLRNPDNWNVAGGDFDVI